MNQNGWYEALEGAFPVLGELSEPLRAAFLREAQRVVPAEGQAAFDYGDRCASFVFVLCGRIRVTRAIEHGREILLYTVQPGDSCILTVSGILGDQPYLARGVWEDKAMAFVISRAFFLRLMAESEAFRGFIFRSFGERISHLMELVDSVVWKPVSARLARLLLARSREGVVRASHQDLANELGTVREVVSRSLGEMARRGLVRLSRLRVEILDPEGLEGFGA